MFIISIYLSLYMFIHLYLSIYIYIIYIYSYGKKTTFTFGFFFSLYTWTCLLCILHLLISLKHIFVRYIHVCNCISFSSISIKYYFIYIQIYFSMLLLMEILSYFQFEAFINNVAINSSDTLVHMCKIARVYSGYISWIGIASLYHIGLSTLPNCFPKSLCHFILSSAKWESFIIPHGITHNIHYYSDF